MILWFIRIFEAPFYHIFCFNLVFKNLVYHWFHHHHRMWDRRAKKLTCGEHKWRMRWEDTRINEYRLASLASILWVRNADKALIDPSSLVDRHHVFIVVFPTAIIVVDVVIVVVGRRLALVRCRFRGGNQASTARPAACSFAHHAYSHAQVSTFFFLKLMILIFCLPVPDAYSFIVGR